MSWNLKVDTDLDDLADAARLAAAMLRTGRPFMGMLDYEEYGPGFEYDNPVLFERKLDPKQDQEGFFQDRIARLRNNDGFIAMHLRVTIDDTEPFFRPVYVYIFGSAHVGFAQYRRRYPMVIDFDNRQRWKKGRDNLITGEPADEDFIIRWLTAICDLAQPKSLYVVNEESVSIPFNYHLVYHNTCQGHVDDLREIARLALYGGRGYNDRRDHYQPLLDIHDESMLFCRRAGMRLDDLKYELSDRRDLLKQLAHGLPVPDDIVETALLQTHRTEPMDTKQGFGFVCRPFLRDYGEYFYWHMLHLLERSQLSALELCAELLQDGDEHITHVDVGPEQAAHRLGMADKTGDAERPMVDLVVEDDRGRLVPTAVIPTAQQHFPSTSDPAMAAFTHIARYAPKSIATRIEHYQVLVHPNAALAPGYKVTAEGELWHLLNAQSTPQVWDRVQLGGTSIIVASIDF